MIAVIPSATLAGADGCPVAVEVHEAPGLPNFTVVGLPDAAVREARDRVRAALLCSGLDWPRRRVTVNLAPSGVRKIGAGLDLPIAIGLLAATGQLPDGAGSTSAFVGELGLDGSVRHVPGVLALAGATVADELVVPAADGVQAAAVHPRVRPVAALRQAVEALRGRAPWPSAPPVADERPVAPPDLADVRGQTLGRRALEVAAAGGHHLLLVGPPGSGKTMLAQRLPGLLGELDRSDALEVSRIHSAANLPLPASGLIRRPPFRAPHHSASVSSLVGGGTAAVRPGELSLAHRGVLFLDEMGEFPAVVLDALRQPLEEGVVRVSRAGVTATFPAALQLVAATNPCPCGDGPGHGTCRCSPAARERYGARLSAPLLDRFDLIVPLARPGAPELAGDGPREPSATVASRVARARGVAAARGTRCNGQLDPALLEAAVPMVGPSRVVLERQVALGALSSRGIDRVRRVARTLADLEGDGDPRAPVTVDHLRAALRLRADRRALGLGRSR